MRPLLLITGTDTGVGKTVLTALLATELRRQAVKVAALKPVSSGPRDDARVLQAATKSVITLDEINPWHFRAPLAPVLAARREHRQVTLADVLAHVRKMQKRFDRVLIEGAGGWLSPLGENFSSRELAEALSATPIIVSPNRIGAVNQVRLTVESRSRRLAGQMRVVLMSTARPDISARTNAGLLAEFFDAGRIFELPWLGRQPFSASASVDLRTRRALQALLQG